MLKPEMVYLLVYVTDLLLICFVLWQSQLDHIGTKKTLLSDVEGETGDGSLTSTQQWGEGGPPPTPHFSSDYKIVAH